MNILVCEDEHNLADALVKILETAGYNAEATYDGKSASYSIESGLYDLVILDRMLPYMTGDEIVHAMRRRGDSTPVLMLTAKSQIEDKISGLDAGADDYMTKPFDGDELLARVRALSRRVGEVILDELKFDDLILDVSTHDLNCCEKSVHLSKKEFEVMQMLMAANSRTVSKQDLLTRVWGLDGEAAENSVEAYVSFLRKKLNHINSKVRLSTLRMIGYRLESEESATIKD